MAEFFGFGGALGEPEGYLSWQHLTFVLSMNLIMIALAIIFGLRNRKKDEKTKNLPLVIAAIVIDGFEIFKFVIECINGGGLEPLLYDLPLFLCSIQLFALPFAAFGKGRVRELGLDFVFIFGLLCSLTGTIGAGNDYGTYPVLYYHNVCSAITHCASGFGCLYVGIAGLKSMKKENIWIELVIFTVFCLIAYFANILIGYNYMFLVRGDGTPYDIFYNWVDGNQILYPVLVVGTLLIYILAFYGIHALIFRRKKKDISQENN